MLKALADILWLVAFALFFMMLASVSFFLFLLAISDWTIIPAVLLFCGILYVASRWLDAVAQPENPEDPKPGLLEIAIKHFNKLRSRN